MGGLEAFAVLASEAKIGVAFSLVCLLAPADTQSGAFHAPMYHTAMALPHTENFQPLLCLVLSPLHGSG